MHSNKAASPKHQFGYSKKPSIFDSVETKSQLKPSTFNSYISTPSLYPNSPTSKSSKGISSKPQTSVSQPNQSFPSLQKFIRMQDMVVELLNKHPIQNREINDGLFYLLSVIENITKQKHKDQWKYKSQLYNDEKKHQSSLIDQSTKVNSTLTKLIEISKSREIKDGLYAIKQIQDKAIREIDLQRFTSSPKLQYKGGSANTSGKSYRSKQNFTHRDFQSSEIMTLKQQKIKLMAELNRQIQISNIKSEQIKNLQFQMSKLQKQKIKDQPNRLQRCLSGTISSKNVYEQQQKDKFKDLMILKLQKQVEQLKRQNKQLKQFSISESFISEAFNFRQNQITNQKQHYQNIIKQLKAKIEELQLRSSSNIHKRSGTDFHKLIDFKSQQGDWKKFEQEKIKLMRQLDYYKQNAKNLGQQVASLRNEVYGLKQKLEGKSKHQEFRKKHGYRDA